ncbi:MAG: hypothetical protein ACFFEU_08660 [Candidatus Thorarchaeota archaeon]
MKKSSLIAVALLAALLILVFTDTASAATWGVREGDELKYEATMYTSTIDLTVTLTVEFNVTFVDDYVTANMSEDSGTPVSVFFNTQSLDDDFGINIKSSNGIDIRYIADEQRFQAQMSQISSTLGSVLANFSMARAGNNLLISAYGGGSGSSWTYDAEINYTSDYVLSGMSEDHFATDGVNDAIQNVLWTQVYHHSICTTCSTSSTTPVTTPGTTPATTPGPVTPPDLTIPMIAGASGLFVVIAAFVLLKRR